MEQWQQISAATADGTAKYFDTMLRNTTAAFQSDLQTTQATWGMAMDSAQLEQQKLNADRNYQLSLQRNALALNEEARRDYQMRVDYAANKIDRERQYAKEDLAIEESLAEKDAAAYLEQADSYETRYAMGGDEADMKKADELRQRAEQRRQEVRKGFDNFRKHQSFEDLPEPPAAPYTPTDIASIEDGMVLPQRNDVPGERIGESDAMVAPDGYEYTDSMPGEPVSLRPVASGGSPGPVMIDDMTRGQVRAAGAAPVGEAVGAFVNQRAAQAEAELGPVRQASTNPVNRIIDDALAKSFPKITINPSAQNVVEVSPAPRDRMAVPNSAVQQARSYLERDMSAWINSADTATKVQFRQSVVAQQKAKARQILIGDGDEREISEANRLAELAADPYYPEDRATKVIDKAVSDGYFTPRQADELFIARAKREAMRSAPGKDNVSGESKATGASKSLADKAALVKSLGESWKSASDPDLLAPDPVRQSLHSAYEKASEALVREAGDIEMNEAQASISRARQELLYASPMDPTTEAKKQALQLQEMDFENRFAPKKALKKGEIFQKTASDIIRASGLPTEINYRQIAVESGDTRQGEDMFVKQVAPNILKLNQGFDRRMTEAEAETLAAQLYRVEIEAYKAGLETRSRNGGMTDFTNPEQKFAPSERTLFEAVEDTEKSDVAANVDRQEFVPPDVREKIGKFANIYHQTQSSLAMGGMAGQGARPNPAAFAPMERAVEQAAEALLPDLRERYTTSTGALTSQALAELENIGKARAGMEGEEILMELAKSKAQDYFKLIAGEGAQAGNLSTSKNDSARLLR